MAKRIVTKIGDIFCVDFQDGTKGYFQYIANDRTQLTSSVIRAFKTHYPVDMKISMDEIVQDEVAFYSHTILRAGVAENAWYKVGKSQDLGIDELKEVIFSQTLECRSDILKCVWVDPLTNWYIWHINEEMDNIGILPRYLHNVVELGVIKSYLDIVTRMKYGYFTYTSNEYRIIKRIPRPDATSYIKEDKENCIVYTCFKGDYFDKQVIQSDNKFTRLTRDEAVINHMPEVRRKFSDIYLEYKNFITEEEFNNVWNLADNKL